MTIHWTDKYVGIPFTYYQFDCAVLAERVQREVFGRTFGVPSERWYSSAEGRMKLKHMADQINKSMYLVDKVDKPQEGDLILMRVLGRDMHIGVYTVVRGIPHVLHVLEKQQSVLQQLHIVEAKGFRIVGYYRPNGK